MVNDNLRKISIKLKKEQFLAVENISNSTGKSRSEVISSLLESGLCERVSEENAKLIARTIGEQMQIIFEEYLQKMAR